jgi:serine O-acetyltransferase
MAVAVASARAPRRHWRLREDCEKYYLLILGTRTPSLVSRAKAWLWHFELPCIAVYRLGQLALVLSERSRVLGAVPFAAFLVLQLLVRLVFHLEISHRCRIGPGFHLGHPYGIIIGPTEIGANCNVTHQVTIGMGLTDRSRGVPVIGDDVWIGPGAILTGAITVGDGATIAAGAVVSRDVPARTLVMGNPARVVLTGYDNSGLLGYRLEAGAEAG